jgi:2-amino-4-hydroxy-6-hydroxymethyldihydropteridine diphosphokinase
VLLLGSNLGRRVRQLRRAVESLAAETQIRSVSRMYASAPSGRAFQPWFLNLAVRVATPRSARELLELARRLEREAGRRHGARWGPRTLDVDIILVGRMEVADADLTVPHASMAHRRFCLVPVAEVAPEMTVPPSGRTVSQLLEACEDELEVIAI